MSEQLKLENQICFPLYACAKEIVRLYAPYLDELDLTYTQYITMMIMWEEKEISSKEIGKKLYLDSGTLSPLLKKLEQKGYITRERDLNDERNLLVKITDSGLSLMEKAEDIPYSMYKKINLPKEKAENLYSTLYELLKKMEELSNE